MERRITKRKKNPRDNRKGRRYQPGKFGSKRMDERR